MEYEKVRMMVKVKQPTESPRAWVTTLGPNEKVSQTNFLVGAHSLIIGMWVDPHPRFSAVLVVTVSLLNDQEQPLGLVVLCKDGEEDLVEVDGAGDEHD